MNSILLRNKYPQKKTHVQYLYSPYVIIKIECSQAKAQIYLCEKGVPIYLKQNSWMMFIYSMILNIDSLGCKKVMF